MSFKPWPFTAVQVGPPQPPAEPNHVVIVSFGQSELPAGDRWLLASVAQAHSDGLFSEPLMVMIARVLFEFPGPVWVLELGQQKPGDEAGAVIVAARLDTSLKFRWLVFPNDRIRREVALCWERAE